jgi:hypothetical protein
MKPVRWKCEGPDEQQQENKKIQNTKEAHRIGNNSERKTGMSSIGAVSKIRNVCLLYIIE